jgi:hypothetical protein
MRLIAQVCELDVARDADEFDLWLTLRNFTNGSKITLPVRRHKHMNRLEAKG